MAALVRRYGDPSLSPVTTLSHPRRTLETASCTPPVYTPLSALSSSPMASPSPPPYVSPLITLTLFPTKGRGYRAIQRIRAGQLLFSEKPHAMYYRLSLKQSSRQACVQLANVLRQCSSTQLDLLAYDDSAASRELDHIRLHDKSLCAPEGCVWMEFNAHLPLVRLTSDDDRARLAQDSARVHLNCWAQEVQDVGVVSVAFNLAMLNHSCDRNAVAESDPDNGWMRVVAIRDIEEGAEICISYIEARQRRMNLSAAERERLLSQKWGFNCCCRLHVQGV